MSPLCSILTICMCLLQSAPATHPTAPPNATASNAASTPVKTSTDGVRAGLFDELTPLFADSNPTDGTAEIRSDTPRGVLAGVHVLIAGLPPRDVIEWKLSQSGGDGAKSAPAGAAAYRLIDVPVEQNTGLPSRTEAVNGVINPYVIRRAPFRVFETLEPIASTTSASEQGVLALRIELPIAANESPETRDYEIELTSGDWKQTLRWTVVVHDVAVPPVGPESFGYTNWFSTGIIAQRHGLEPWSEPFWAMLGRYADLMARGRQNTFRVCWEQFATFQDGRPVVDRERLKRYVNLFLERGFTLVEGGHFAGRHKGDWMSKRLDFVMTGNGVNEPQGRAELSALLAEVRAVLDELHLPPKVRYLQHLADEPTDTNAEAYKKLAEFVRRALPGVKIFEATMSREVVGAVDVWCPQVREFQKHRDFFEQRRQAGEQVWVYVCLSPGGPWLNRLLDQERLRPVYLGWALVKYDLAGFLHWGLNHYQGGVDPFTTSCVPFPTPPNYLPAGDSHVVYPGAAGPLSGVRFEAHRIGLEDAELLRILKLRDAAHAERIIDRVLRAFDEYETNVAAYRAARRELLKTPAGGSTTDSTTK